MRERVLRRMTVGTAVLVLILGAGLIGVSCSHHNSPDCGTALGEPRAVAIQTQSISYGGGHASTGHSSSHSGGAKANTPKTGGKTTPKAGGKTYKAPKNSGGKVTGKSQPTKAPPKTAKGNPNPNKTTAKPRAVPVPGQTNIYYVAPRYRYSTPLFVPGYYGYGYDPYYPYGAYPLYYYDRGQDRCVPVTTTTTVLPPTTETTLPR